MPSMFAMSTASISDACVCAAQCVHSTSHELADFLQHAVPDIPTTSPDAPLAVLSAELHSLRDVLSQAAVAAVSTLPSDIASHLPTVIAACSPIVDDLRDVLSAEPSASAASVAQNCAKHALPVLQVCRMAVGLALDLSAALCNNTSFAADATSDIACVLAATAHLRTRVRAEWRDGSEDSSKSDSKRSTGTGTAKRAILMYLKALREQAHAALSIHGDSRPVSPMSSTSPTSPISSLCSPDIPLDCTPDSAVDLDDSFADDLLAFPMPPRSPVRRHRAGLPPLVVPFSATASPPPLLPARSVQRSIAARSAICTMSEETAIHASNNEEETDNSMPSRPPTPPPKAASRGSSALARRSVVRTSFDSSAANTVLMTEDTATSVDTADTTTTETTAATVVTAITAGEKARPVLLPASKTSAPIPAPSLASSRLSVLGLFRSRSRTGRHARVASAAVSAVVAPALTTNSGSSHTGRRFSLAVPSVRFLAGSSADPDNSSKEPCGAVFGVPLRKSLAVASTAARTHHGGPSSKESAKKSSSSVRAFPLCVFSCYVFLGAAGTDRLGAPGLFDAAHTDQLRVARLRTIFSTAPCYGKDVFTGTAEVQSSSSSSSSASADGYTPHDAAALILEFLTALPRPLVSEATARRWVALSRQAAADAEAEDSSRWTATSHATRVDKCLDFWDEALGGGGLGRDSAAARSLLKLLLNLWGDVADAAERNGMPAERLAGKVLEPLMHLDGGGRGTARHTSASSSSSSSSAYTRTDYMLGLAFIIRKRSEYGQLLRGSGRKSKAAFSG